MLSICSFRLHLKTGIIQRRDQIPDKNTRTKSKYPVASLDKMPHLWEQRRTALYQSTTLFQPGMYNLTHTTTKGLARHGLGFSRVLARAGTLFLSSMMLLLHQKQQLWALCSEPRTMQKGRIYIQFLEGARSSPNNLLQKTQLIVGSAGFLPSAQHNLEVVGITGIEM